MRLQSQITRKFKLRTECVEVPLVVAEEGLECADVVVLRGTVARRRGGREERRQVEAPLDEHTGALRLR